MKKGVLKNFKQFTGTQQCQSLFLIKLQTEACNFIKKEETLTQVFSCKFCEIAKIPFLAEHFQWLLLSIRSFKMQNNFCFWHLIFFIKTILLKSCLCSLDV